jgi:hypothetical protein
MAWTELLTYTIEWHDITLPLWGVVVIFAKNAPSMEIGERFAADRLRLTGRSSSRENPQARKSAREHRLDCAPVSATADTTVSRPGAWLGLVILVSADLTTEMVTLTLG